MMNFFIGFSGDEFQSEGDLVASGVLKIGDFTESLQISLSYWNREQYLDQWREALERLLKGGSSSAIVTTMYDSNTANFIFWWVMYLIGDSVHIQNHVLFLDELEQPFDEFNLYRFIPKRETHTEEGEPISEWVIKVTDLQACFDSLPIRPNS